MFNFSTNDPHKQKAYELINSGRISAATKLLKNICRSNEYDDEAWLLLGELNGQQGKYREAIKCFEKAVKAQPGNDKAHFMLGFTWQHLGKHAEALKSYRTAIRVNPSHSDARNNLASALLLLNRHEEAFEVCREALESDPVDILWLINAGKACYGLNDLVNSEKYFKQALELEPDNYDALTGMGGVLEKNNDPVSAIEIYRKALQARPDLPRANNNLALALYSNKQVDEAIHYCKQAISIDSGYIPAYLNLGLAYQDKFMLEDAVRIYQQVLKIEPKNVAVLNNLAIVLSYQGRLGQALTHYKAATRLKPDFLDAVAGEVRVLTELGDIESASQRLEPYAATRKSNISIALAFSGLARSADQQRDSINNLEQLLEHGTSSADELRRIHFQLADLYDKAHSYDQAFKHYQQGNQLKPGHFERIELHRYVDRNIATFSQQSLSALPRATNDSELPVFIVGMPRSGKTLIEQILASHPQVTGAGELPDIGEMTRMLKQQTGKPFPLYVGELTVEQLNDLANAYLSRRQAEAFPGTIRVTDTMPFNVDRLGFISMLFSHARIIHCRRDPRDILLECYFKDFGWDHPYANDLADLGYRYQQYDRLCQHWKNVLGLPQLEVHYEQLVREPETVARQLTEYLGLEWEPRCLELHESGNLRLTGHPSFREPVNNHSVGRWKNYQRHLQPLFEALQQ